MTRVEFFSEGDKITGFCCQGHSGYAESGADIVCAAVSTAVTFAETTITDVLGVRVEGARPGGRGPDHLDPSRSV